MAVSASVFVFTGVHNDVCQKKSGQTSKLCLFSESTGGPGLRRPRRQTREIYGEGSAVSAKLLLFRAGYTEAVSEMFTQKRKLHKAFSPRINTFSNDSTQNLL